MSHHENQFAWRCGTTTVLGAFLLFQVQPLISKIILPWFGGSPAVWTTCMLFFQVVLLLGYVYADGLVRKSRTSWQPAIHVSLLLVACLMLPITRAELFKPVDSTNPTGKILVLLVFSIGMPYLMVSTSGPLLQAWFARTYPEQSPYFLYSLSNTGSLAALLSYPVLVEPFLTVKTQGLIWSGAFVVFAAMTAWLCCSMYLRHRPSSDRTLDDSAAAGTATNQEPIPWYRFILWLFLPAMGSMMLLAVTNQLCQNVAVVPLLWIAPLSLYLLSFILCFAKDGGYVRRWYALGAVIAVILTSKLLLAKHVRDAPWYLEMAPLQFAAGNQIAQILFYLVALFLICMVCHGEVVRTKPPARQLTLFYVSLAAGGAVGGMFVSLVCPHVFSTYLEINLGLVASFVLAAVVLYLEGKNHWMRRPVIRAVYALTALFALVVVLWAQIASADGDWLIAARNFYGVLTIEEKTGPGDAGHTYSLYSGSSMHGGATMHGFQFASRELRMRPTGYYGAQSGVGLALRRFPRQGNRHVGVVGLGVGTVAAYGAASDTYRFYEINPLVKHMALQYFSFLTESSAQTLVELGDGRLMLDRQAPQQFDVLVLDAFTGDTIPTHLLTREAFAVYLQKHLKQDGVLAVHISNRYLNLLPVVARLAAHFDMSIMWVRDHGSDQTYPTASDWVLITRNERFLADADVRSKASSIPPEAFQGPLWTDQHNNLLQLLWHGRS